MKLAFPIILIAAAVGVTPLAQGTPVELAPGGVASYDPYNLFTLTGDLQTGTPQTSYIGGLGTSANYLYSVTASVYANVEDNPNTGLTFAYTIHNNNPFDVLPIDGIGIISAVVGGWGSGNIFVDLDQSTSDDVVPDSATRNIIGDAITFSFPFGAAPPIYLGQTGMQLLVFTDATSYGNVNGQLNRAADIGGPFPGRPFYRFETLGAAPAAGVPDEGATAALILLGAGLCFLGAARKRGERTRR